ncbi:MAG: hypothetical protein HY282_16375 [Nitrospirae bacterium]|nr:hypothetical protein [Candidatus Manganitrophaceae bacterium]
MNQSEPIRALSHSEIDLRREIFKEFCASLGLTPGDVTGLRTAAQAALEALGMSTAELLDSQEAYIRMVRYLGKRCRDEEKKIGDS